MQVEDKEDSLEKTTIEEPTTKSQATPEANQEDLQDFATFLQRTLQERIQANPNYSLRAFSRSLGFDYSTMSKILRRKRPVGRRVAHKLGTKLGLTPEEIAGSLPTKKKQP